MEPILHIMYADKFIVSGATTPAYLMSDGSTVAVSVQNSQSNIYLYHNSTMHSSPQMQARLDIIMLIIRLLQRFGYHILREMGTAVHL